MVDGHQPSTSESWKKHSIQAQLLLLIIGEFESLEIHLMISQKSTYHHVQKGTCNTFLSVVYTPWS